MQCQRLQACFILELKLSVSLSLKLLHAMNEGINTENLYTLIRRQLCVNSWIHIDVCDETYPTYEKNGVRFKFEKAGDGVLANYQEKIQWIFQPDKYDCVRYYRNTPILTPWMSIHVAPLEIQREILNVLTK